MYGFVASVELLLGEITLGSIGDGVDGSAIKPKKLISSIFPNKFFLKNYLHSFNLLNVFPVIIAIKSDAADDV